MGDAATAAWLSALLQKEENGEKRKKRAILSELEFIGKGRSRMT